MADEKDGGKPGGWFPNLNNLLLILVAGTLLVNQHAFHSSRPSKPESAPINQVNARLWQDPFEVVGPLIPNNANSGEAEGITALQDDIKKKLKVDSNESQEKTTNLKTLVTVQTPPSTSDAVKSPQIEKQLLTEGSDKDHVGVSERLHFHS
jgi:hypothetical protein